MSERTCRCEADLLESLTLGQWPDAAPRELREHVDACSSCRELALAAGALLSDRRATEAEAHVPPSGAVWWRIQMRTRQESQLSAARAVQGTQTVILAATIAAILVAVALSPLLGHAWKAATSALGAATMPVVSPLVLFLSVAPLVLLAPVAVWLAFARER